MRGHANFKSFSGTIGGMPMKSSADVVYRDIDSSPALNHVIEKKLEKLHRYSDSILRSRVVLGSPHNHKHKGKMFRATIELGMKGTPLNISHDDASVHIAVRDAFAAVERALKEDASRKRAIRH
jgi:ribosomal subunit interface protein